jgi:hypothetical protein
MKALYRYGKLSGYCDHWQRGSAIGDEVNVKAEPLRIVPLKGDLRELCERCSGLGLTANLTQITTKRTNR